MDLGSGRRTRPFFFNSDIQARPGLKSNIGFEINSPFTVVQHFSAMISVGIKIGHGDGNFLIMALTGSLFRLMLHLKALIISFGSISDAYRIDESQIPEIFKKYRVLQTRRTLNSSPPSRLSEILDMFF
jgi:hypothetical protein